VLPWNRVLSNSRSIFQTSYEHVLVAVAVCTLFVCSSDRSDRLTSPSKN
jgi:hypothetical protein